MLQHLDEQIHGLVEIFAVHHAVVRVGAAHGNQQAHGGHAAVAFLDLGRVVAVSAGIRLERDASGK